MAQGKELSGFMDFCGHIFKEPVMYGINRVEDVGLMLYGYVSATEGDDISNFMFDFRGFVNKRFGLEGDNDWQRLIRFYSASDTHSIELFSKIFFDFLAEKNIELPH